MKACSSFANILLLFARAIVVAHDSFFFAAAENVSPRLVVVGTDQEHHIQDDTPTTRMLKKKKKKKKQKHAKAPKTSKSGKAMASLSPSSPPTNGCVVEGIITQKDALLALKEGFKFTNDTNFLSSWAADTNPCSESTSTWFGITCNSNGLVTDIKLHYYNYFSNFTATISPLIGCPTTLVTSLKYINISGNNLAGTIPKELGQLTSLTHLDIDDNILTGTIPTELAELTGLIKLYVSDNKLTGTIPKGLRELTSLTTLWFRYNNLIGSMPSEICDLKAGNLASLTADWCDKNPYGEPVSPKVDCTCCTDKCDGPCSKRREMTEHQ